MPLREKDLHQADGEEPRFTMEAGDDQVDEPGGSKDSSQGQKRRDQKKDGKDRFGQLRSLFVPLFGSQPSIYGDK